MKSVTMYGKEENVARSQSLPDASTDEWSATINLLRNRKKETGFSFDFPINL